MFKKWVLYLGTEKTETNKNIAFQVYYDILFRRQTHFTIF